MPESNPSSRRAADDLTKLSDRSRPLRILHVLGSLGHGGIEVWLMNVMRAIDRNEFQFDFAIEEGGPKPFHEEVRDLGGRIVEVKAPQRSPLSFRRQLRRLLRQDRAYDIMHAHVHSISGYPLKIAARVGIPMRIAHSHADLRREEAEESLPRKAVAKLGKRWIQRYATDGLAISEFAAASLFGGNWDDDPRFRILLYGFDFSRFAKLPSREELRRKLGLPAGRKVIGQVGRLVDQKNYPFSIRVIEELVRRQIDLHFLVVGSGNREEAIRNQIQEAGLSDRVTLAGDQHEVAPFYGAMDCMLFPSNHEGLGIVALEAQAAGVPVVASEHVPPEIDVIRDLVDHVPLAAGVARWCQTVQQQLAKPPMTRHAAVQQLAQSDFALQRSIDHLCAAYRGGVGGTEGYFQTPSTTVSECAAPVNC